MKTNSILLVVLGIVIVLGISGCTGGAASPVGPAAAPERAVVEEPTVEPGAVPEPTAVPEPAVDPAEAVVLTMIERVNAKDYAGASELVADDLMSYFIGMPPTGMEIYWGRDQFRTFLEECCTDQNFEWQVAPQGVADGVVTAESKTWMDFTRELGVAPNSFHEIFVVQDGQITLYVSMMTEEALAKFKPPLFAAIPELAAAVQTPAESDETPVNEIDFTITNGTCAYDGPMTLQSGDLSINVEVQDQLFDKYALSLFTLDEGKDLIDLMASTYNPSPPTWSDIVFLREFAPGEKATIDDVSVPDGSLYMICWGGPPDIAIGNAGPFLVSP